MQHKRQSQVDAYLELLGRECREWERLLHARLSLSDCGVASSANGAGAITDSSGFSVSSKGKIKKRNNLLKKNLHCQPNPFHFLHQNVVHQHPSSQQHQNPREQREDPFWQSRNAVPPQHSPQPLAMCSDRPTNAGLKQAW